MDIYVNNTESTSPTTNVDRQLNTLSPIQVFNDKPGLRYRDKNGNIRILAGVTPTYQIIPSSESIANIKLGSAPGSTQSVDSNPVMLTDLANASVLRALLTDPANALRLQSLSITMTGTVEADLVSAAKASKGIIKFAGTAGPTNLVSDSGYWWVDLLPGTSTFSFTSRITIPLTGVTWTTDEFDAAYLLLNWSADTNLDSVTVYLRENTIEVDIALP